MVLDDGVVVKAVGVATVGDSSSGGVEASGVGTAPQAERSRGNKSTRAKPASVRFWSEVCRLQNVKLFYRPIRSDAVDAEIPEQHHADSECLCQIVAEAFVEEVAEYVLLHHDQQDRVDDQPQDIDDGALCQLAGDRQIA